MLEACSAYGCGNKIGVGKGTLSFFRFPFYDKQRLSLWKQAIRRNDWSPTRVSVLCSEHFTSDSFLEWPEASKLRLRWDAVPSIFPDLPYYVQTRTHKQKGIAESHSNKSLDELYFSSQVGPSTGHNNSTSQVSSEKNNEEGAKKRRQEETSRILSEKRRKEKISPIKKNIVDFQDLDSKEGCTSDLPSQDDAMYGPGMAIEFIDKTVKDYIFKLVYDGKSDMAAISRLVKTFVKKELFLSDKSQGQFYPDMQTISMVVSQAKSKMAKTVEENEPYVIDLEADNSNTNDLSANDIEVITLIDTDEEMA